MSSPTEIDAFAEKLRVVLQATGYGRARLAQLAGIDKSVASRWLAGQTRPSEASLERLTENIRRIRPEFTRQDWHRPLPELGRALGISEEAPALAVADPAAPVANPWAQPGNDITTLEAAYAGAWVFFYASMQAQPRITCNIIEMSRHADTLVARVGHIGVWRGAGPVFARNAKLFFALDDQLRGTAIAFYVLWGVQSSRALVLDGLNMTQATDPAGTIANTRCLGFRLADPLPPGEAADARFERLVAHLAQTGTLALAALLPEPLRALYHAPPPVEGLPVVHRVTAERSLAISEEGLRWAEDENGPRRQALRVLLDSFAAALAG